MSRQIFQVYLEPNNVTSENASKILDRLNSLNSAAEIMNVLRTHAGQRVIGLRIAQRILSTKTQVGKFQDLNQIATVPGIGYKRFTNIMSALGDHI
jgi:transcriptional accessory protein Tex/SPT6